MLVYFGCVCTLLQLAISHPSTRVTYNGHRVLEILHKTEADYMKLLNMELKYELDFWKMPKHTNDSMTVRVGPQYLHSFLNELQSLNADVRTLIDDVQELLDSHQSSNPHRQEDRRAATRIGSGFDLETYWSHTEISTYLNYLAAQSLVDVHATVEELGDSYEGRKIEMIKISSIHGSSQKRGIFIDGGIHAREWVAPATVIYTIEQLAYNPDNVPAIDDLLLNYDIYLVPLVNPDGYEFSHNTQRLWRKNRKINSGSSCVGVDLNRNFAHQWNPNVGGSYNPCSDIYSGTDPASELETKAIANFLTREGHNIDAYLTLHSYGQMWLYPWGYTSALPDDWSDLHHGADMATSAIQSPYTIGSSTNTLYAAAGGSDDFAKGGAGIKYAYTIELRDTGRYGFVLPERLIQPTADEFLQGLLALYTVL